MNRRDVELLSAYLDGELKPSDLAKMEKRLQSDPELESVLEDLRATRTLLRHLPSRKAPRNFTLTRKMVGQNPPLPRTYPIFRLATMVATLLFFFSFGINSFSSQMASQPVGFGMGGGNDSLAEQSQAMEEPAAESELYADSSPAEEPPAAPAPAVATEAASTADATRVMETPTSKTGEEEQLQVQSEAQSPATPIPSTWQMALAGIALLGTLFMVLMRQISARRWK